MTTETLVQRRARLKARLDAIRTEQGYGVWRGGDAEPTKLKRAIVRIDRRIKRGKA